MDSQLDDDISSYTSLLQQASHVPLDRCPLFSQSSPDQDVGSRQRRGNNFSTNEDKLLVSGWLNTSLDPIVGTDMKSGGFWKKVENYYIEAKESDWTYRSGSSLSHRWSSIQHAVNKFCGCLSQIERMHRSGVSKEDNIQDARKMFQQLYKKSFRYDHCWDILKYEQKWINRSIYTVNSKRKELTPCSMNHEPTDARDDIHSINEKNNNERPTGRKAAKERKKLSKDDIKDSAMLSNALCELKEEKKKAHEDRMLKYNSNTEQRAKFLEIQKVQFEIQKAQLLETKEGNRIKHEKLKLEQEREDMEIMIKDGSSMNSMQQEYLKFRQMEIQKK